MKLFGLEIRKASKKEINSITAWNWGHSPRLGSRNKPLLLATVYRCVDLISDSVAIMPFELFYKDKDGYKQSAINNPLYDVLNLEPNENMTRYVFFKTLVTSVLLTGNGYAYIERDSKMNVVQLVYIPSYQVDIVFITDRNGIPRKRYKVTGWKQLVEPKDMIHVLNFSNDGIIGISTLTHARQTLGLATDTEEYAAGFFKSGGAISGILKVTDRKLSEKEKDKIYETWKKRTSDGSNGIAVMEGNMDFQTISVSPKDAQFIEARIQNNIDICRFFGVSPVKVFDLSKSSYSTIEATQLEYLTDTVQPMLTKIEQEINRKIFLAGERDKMLAEFNTSALLRTDPVSQATYIEKLTQCGAITPNEARKRNGLPRIDSGDEAFVQVNMQTLKNAIKDRPVKDISPNG